MFKDFIATIRLFLLNKKEPYVMLKEILGFTPYTLSLYDQALLHRSVARRNEKGKLVNNERLEFLGDSVLDTIVADILYKRYPNRREGFLTNTRSKIVQRNSLNQIAVDLGLDKIMTIAPSVRTNSNCIYGNGLEALVGAIYLDRGYRKTKAFVEQRIIDPFINLNQLSETEVNFKSRLIEWGQKNRIDVQFNLLELYTNDRQEQIFETEICLAGISAGKGVGSSKKESQQHASEAAFKRLHQDVLFRREVTTILYNERSNTLSNPSEFPEEIALPEVAHETAAQRLEQLQDVPDPIEQAQKDKLRRTADEAKKKKLNPAQGGEEVVEDPIAAVKEGKSVKEGTQYPSLF